MGNNLEKLILERDETSNEGTFGRILRNGVAICETCELPWLNNQRGVSCIAKGNYLVTRYASPTKGNVFLLNGTEPREQVEIHAGNTILDIKGCILPGSRRGFLKNLPAVLNSKPTLQAMLADLPNSFYLQITGVCG